MSILDLQGLQLVSDAPAGGGGGSHNSSAGGSCADSNLSVALCHESGLSAVLC